MKNLFVKITYILIFILASYQLFSQDILVPPYPSFNLDSNSKCIDTKSYFKKGWNWDQGGKEIMSYEL